MEAIKSARLFKSDFWERLTHVHHNTPLFIYIPVILIALIPSIFLQKLSPVYIAGGIAGGLLIWSFFEYTLHRIIFHYEPKSEWGKKIAYLFHGVHHDFPTEADRLVMPPSGSVPIALSVLLIHLAIGGLASLPFYAGFQFGYLYYEFVHYSVHHKKKILFGWSEAQRKNHLLHHFKDHTNRFGVTSPLWDYVFKTYKTNT